MTKGNFEQFLEELGELESGKPSGDVQQYEAVNNFTGATGKYQFTQILMDELGYYQNDTNTDDNIWDGEFLGKNGITSLESWKNSPAVQETGIRESFFVNYGFVNGKLSDNGIPTLDQTFLSNNQDTKTVKFYKLNRDENGKVIDFERDANGQPVLNEDPALTQVNLSLSGIIAGAHLRGGIGVGEVLSQLNQKDVVDFTDVTEFDLDYYDTFLYDEINTSIFKFINDFGDFDVQNSDFELPSYGDTENYVLYGTLNPNSIDGSDGNDQIYGLQGDDSLAGLNGDDSLDGGRGRDMLDGGRGRDVLDGGIGSDTLDGGVGNDLLYGGIGRELVYGGSGSDTLYGESGRDTLYGGKDRDTLYGGSGRDSLLGGDGNDFLDGWFQSSQTGQIDTLIGGEGSDTFALGNEIDGVYYQGDGYAAIEDFDLSGGDKLQLTGSIEDYSVLSSSDSSSLQLNYRNDLIAEISLIGTSNVTPDLLLDSTSVVIV